MNTATDQIFFTSTGQLLNVDDLSVGFDLREALRETIGAALLEGIQSVRLLPSEERYANAHDKVFFVLATHDIERDERIVQLMMQFEGVDYDLVPEGSVGMIPSGAVAV